MRKKRHTNKDAGGSLVMQSSRRVLSPAAARFSPVDKIFSITLDNASVNDKMIKYVKENLLVRKMLHVDGNFLHSRCAAHVLNLIVQDGLKVLKGLIDNIRESVKFVKSIPARKDKFDEIVARIGISGGKCPCYDTPTRWNSSYLMTNYAQPFRNAFRTLSYEEPNYTFCPSDEEWKRAEAICNFLKTFYTATNIVSGSSYPTTHLYFPQMWSIKVLLDKEATNQNTIIHEMIPSMKEKFKKYWKESCLSMCIPVVFDPRFKFDYIVFHLQSAFGYEADETISLVKQTIEDLFFEYSIRLGRPIFGITQEQNHAENDVEENDVMADWDEYLSEQQQQATNELDTYLKDDLFPRKDELNILGWWDLHSSKYPVISCITSDVLAIQASTVSSESAFNTGQRVISDYRSRLSAETTEALLCLQDWLRTANPDYFGNLDDSDDGGDASW